LGSAIATLVLLNACSSDLLLATWVCKPQSGAAGASSTGTQDFRQFDADFKTSFETGACDYSVGNGSCYAAGDSSYRIVDAPVRSGKYAAAFTVFAEGGKEAGTRCHRDGELPQAALYGAWFYLPAVAQNKNNGNWNLVHFQGGNSPGDKQRFLWDVSLENDSDGVLRLYVINYVPDPSKSTRMPLLTSPPVPIGKWFYIGVYLKRASDATGEIIVYQDKEKIVNSANLMTDNTPYGQWYIGNLATNLSPPEYTLYIDDVSIGPGPGP
jgi:hypothetical protein